MACREHWTFCTGYISVRREESGQKRELYFKVLRGRQRTSEQQRATSSGIDTYSGSRTSLISCPVSNHVTYSPHAPPTPECVSKPAWWSERDGWTSITHISRVHRLRCQLVLFRHPRVRKLAKDLSQRDKTPNWDDFCAPFGLIKGPKALKNHR